MNKTVLSNKTIDKTVLSNKTIDKTVLSNKTIDKTVLSNKTIDKTVLCKEGYLIPKIDKYNDIIKSLKKELLVRPAQTCNICKE
jgi:hypothetical protein